MMYDLVYGTNNGLFDVWALFAIMQGHGYS